MKHTKRILLLMAILLQSNIAISQRILIKETVLNRNTELLTEIESMTRVVSACQIDVNKDVLFTEDTSFQVIMTGLTDTFSKVYIEARDVNSFSFYGKNDNSLILISFLGDDIQGYALIQGQVYAIETYGNNYFMIQWDLNSLHEDCDDLEENTNSSRKEGNGRKHQGNIESQDTKSLYDDRMDTRSLYGAGDSKVLVLYTANAASSVSDIVNTAFVAEGLSNISFSNSNVNCKIEIVYVGQTNYQEVDSHTDVDRYAGTNDGYMDEVHSLREKYSADVCVLLTDYHDETCGKAKEIKANSDEAFCVVQAKTCATTNHSFIHEIGHLVGCRHDFRNDPSLWPYTYCHGYVYPDGGWRTIMAYNTYCTGCDRLPFWSKPEVLHEGVPMGTSGFNNNAKVWNNRYEDVGGFENVATNLTITSSTIPGTLNYGFIEAASNVGTNGNVSLNSGQSLTIKAGNEIVFSDGFEASAGSELSAYISQQSTMCYATSPKPSTIEVNTVRNIEKTNMANTVVIYPNPTTNELHIQNDGQERPTDIIILDIMGKVVKHLDYFNSEIKITQIPAGTYFIEIVFANRTERYKVIKK